MKGWLQETSIQFEWLRFVAIGIKSNLLYYVIYVALSLVGIGPKTAVTIVFFVESFTRSGSTKYSCSGERGLRIRKWCVILPSISAPGC